MVLDGAIGKPQNRRHVHLRKLLILGDHRDQNGWARKRRRGDFCVNISMIWKICPRAIHQQAPGHGRHLRVLGNDARSSIGYAESNREEMRQRIERGIFTVRDLRDQMSNLTQMGSIGKIASMIPGMSNMMAGLGGGDGDEMSQKMKRMVFIFDAMTPRSWIQMEVCFEGNGAKEIITINLRTVNPGSLIHECSE
ncbi:hypothetical protein KEM48_007164 [Puccinia striiformis f. sp. tritici PST-130]|nr:hypothetical protein KEM48_007164 [Puccinia striiformis f. sp. tritici PST-130]